MSLKGVLNRSDARLEIKIDNWQLTNWMFCYFFYYFTFIFLRRDQFDNDLQSLWISKFWRGIHMSWIWHLAELNLSRNFGTWPSGCKSSLPHIISSPDGKWVFHQGTSLSHLGQLWKLISSPASKTTISPGVGFFPLPSVINSANLSFLFQKY